MRSPMHRGRMKIEVLHALDLDEAIARMRTLTEYWQRKYTVESRWTKAVSNLAGSVLGVAFEATLSVDKRRIVFEGPDPGILLRRQVIGYLTCKVDEYLVSEVAGSRAISPLADCVPSP